jgi:hypothetical protein
VPRADRYGTAGLLAAAAGLACLLATALLGPSVMEPVLVGPPGQPPYSLVTHPPAGVVIALTAAGLAAGAAGVGLCLYAVRLGWRMRPKALLVCGVLAAVAFMMMPPVGSADHLNYAAYGRMAATGNDPYTATARQFPADPVVREVQDWRGVPTVYGPIATAQETFASLIGGRSMRLTVFVMSVTGTLAFVAVGLLLHRAAGGDRRRALRAALLWTANPLMLFALVGGAHNDVLAIAFAVAGLVIFALPDPLAPRPPADGPPAGRRLLAGMLIGVGAAVKINVAILGGGPAWVLLRAFRPHGRTTRGVPWRAVARAAVLFAAAAVVAGLAYLMAGPHSFDQLSRASKAVSLATPWHLVAGAGGGLLATVPRSWVQLGSALLAVVLAAVLLRALPRTTVRGAVPDPGADDAVRVAAALALAWLFAAPYALPWYDGLGWAALALVPASGMDWLLLARTVVLSLAYLPARDPRHAGLPADLGWLVTGVRATVTPWMLAFLVAAVLAWGVHSRRVPAPVRSPRAPAEPRA